MIAKIHGRNLAFREYKTSDYYFDDKDGEGHEANEVFFTLVGGKQPIPEGWKQVPFLLSSFRTNVVKKKRKKAKTDIERQLSHEEVIDLVREIPRDAKEM